MRSIALPVPHLARRAALFLLLGFALIMLQTQNTKAAVNVAELESPGGLAFWLVEDDTLPLIALRFGFDGGAAQDPEGRAGTANLVSALLSEGAGPHDSLAFNTLLEDHAVRMSFDASHDRFTGGLTVLANELETGADLLRLALSEPRFDADAVERVRGQVLASLRREQSDPQRIAGRLFAETLYEGHPYGRPSRGSLESVPEISIDNLRAYQTATFARDNLSIAIVGAISSEDAGALVDTIFGGLPEAASLSPVEDITLPTGVVTQDERDLAQTVIRFALPGIARDDEDFIPAFVMNHILGGGSFSSRLFTEVRQARGLTYSVGTYLGTRDHNALLGGGASTRPERAQETLDVIREVIAGFLEEGPTDEELRGAKDFLIGSYPLRFDSSNAVARQLLGLQMEDFPASYMTERAGLIEAVTREDVVRVAERLLREPLSLVIVGQPLS